MTNATPDARRRLVYTVLVALALLAAAILGLRAALAPRQAPEVEFHTISGEQLSLRGMRGEVVLIEFWATTCSICIAEMPELARLFRDLAPRGLRMVAVAMPYDRPDHVLAFARRTNPPFAVAIDPYSQAVGALGPVPGTPTRVLVDRSGRIAARMIGRVDLDRLRRLIETELTSASS